MMRAILPLILMFACPMFAWAGASGDYDGTNDALTTASTGFDEDIGTFLFWFNPDANIEDYAATSYYFDSDGARNAYYVRVTDDSIQMYNDGLATDFEELDGLLDAGVWHRVAFQWNKTGNVQKLWIDGAEMTADATAGTWGSTALGTDIHFLQRISDAERNDGQASYFQVFTTFLSEAEMTEAFLHPCSILNGLIRCIPGWSTTPVDISNSKATVTVLGTIGASADGPPVFF